jgi:mRNA interferase MazF
MKPGEIWLIPFPYTDLTDAKRRPALVLDVDMAFLALSVPTPEDALLLAISSIAGSAGPRDIVFPETDPAFRASGLRQTSVFKIPKLFTLHTSLTIRRLGVLNRAWFDRVRAAVRRCI